VLSFHRIRQGQADVNDIIRRRGTDDIAYMLVRNRSILHFRLRPMGCRHGHHQGRRARCRRDAGHHDIAVVTGPLVSPLSRDRLIGVRAAAEARGLSAQLQVWHGDFSPESGRRCAAEIIEARVRPTTIFCFSDEMAIGALTALRAVRIACPDDMSLIGFDDIPMARYCAPPLTTIRQPSHEIGRQTVRLLVAILGKSEIKPASVTPPHRLIVRQSVAAPRPA